MNAVVTSHLLVCLYSAAGKKAKRQDFYTRRTPACTRCAVDRRDQTVTLQGGTATRWEIESFLDNELREGVFWTFGFLKLRRLFSRIKLVTKNDLAPRRGYCWDHASSPKVLQGETASAKSCLYVMPKLPLMKLRCYSVSEDDGSNRLKDGMTF